MHQADVLKNMIKQFNNQHNQPQEDFRPGATPKKPTHSRNSKSEHFAPFSKQTLHKAPYEHMVIQEEQELYRPYQDSLYSQQKQRQSFQEPCFAKHSSSQKNKENKVSFPVQPQPSHHLQKRLYNYARKQTDPEISSRQNSLQYNECPLGTMPSQNSAQKNPPKYDCNTSQKKNRDSFMILDKSYLQRKNSLTHCKAQVSQKKLQEKARSGKGSCSKVSTQTLRKMNSSTQNTSQLSGSKLQDLENENQVLKYMLQESESSLQKSKKYNEQFKYQMKIEQQKQFLELQAAGENSNSQAICKIEKQIQYLESLNQQIDSKKNQHSSQKYIQHKVKAMSGPSIQKRPLSNVLNLLTL